MKAVVLAGGKGTRLRPLTDSKPKSLVEVNGSPLLTYCFNQLASLDINEIVVVVGYRGSQIIEHYGHTFADISLTYVHQSEPKGLGHALLAAEEHVEDEFVLIYGDVIFRTDLKDCIDHHHDTVSDATLLVMDFPQEEAKQSGVCVVDDDGEITSIVEKPDDPPSTLCLPGFFVFDPVILTACNLLTPSGRGEYELLDAIDLLVHAGRPIEWIQTEGWRINVNTPSDIALAERKLSEEQSANNK